MDTLIPKNTANDSSNQITLSIDAMGGDLGPSVVLQGLAKAQKQHKNLRFSIHGPKATLAPLIKKYKLSELCTLHHCDESVKMDDKPSLIIRNGKNTSMWSAIDAVRDGSANAIVSCGNTGALMAISMLRLRKLPGVNRPAIGILWPSSGKNGFNVMLDVGADVRADAQDLLQYALMGASYSRNGFGLSKPRIGLLNVGTEEHKGHTELKTAYELIEQNADTADYDFVGFLEGNDIPSNKADVIVTDGFTGNIALKSAEGTASFIRTALNGAFRHSFLSKFAALIACSSLRRLSQRIDPRRLNGGVFLGLNGTVVKSHGAADSTGVAAAVSLAYRLAQADFSTRLASRIASAKQKTVEDEK